MALVQSLIIFMCIINYTIYAIPMCPIPVDKRFPESMHVDGETMCPNGCCNWTLDGCCPGSHVIPQDQLDAVETPYIIYHGGDSEEDDRHGHDRDRKKRRHVEEFTDDEFVDDEDANNDPNMEINPYTTGFRILGIIVVIVGLLNLAYPDHLRV